MKLRFLPAAEAELIREVTYYAVNARHGTAPRFQAAVEAATKMALRHPLGGAPSHKGTRAYKVAGFPFLIVYRPSSSEVLVVAVAPTSKKENYWASRVGDVGESRQRFAVVVQTRSGSSPFDHGAALISRKGCGLAELQPVIYAVIT